MCVCVNVCVLKGVGGVSKEVKGRHVLTSLQLPSLMVSQEASVNCQPAHYLQVIKDAIDSPQAHVVVAASRSTL